MDRLPISNIRSSWIAALMNTILVFAIYYVSFFGGLLKLYENQFEELSFTMEKTDLTNIDQSNLTVWAFVPKYYHPAITSWAFIFIQNMEETPLRDVEVFLITSSKGASNFLLPRIYENDVYNNGIKFPLVESRSAASARIPLVIQKETKIVGVIVRLESGNNVKQVIELKTVNVVYPDRSNKAFRTNFIETILLPPWSNGFIFAIVLFATYLSVKENQNSQDEDPDTFSSMFWKNVGSISLRSLLIIVVIVILVGLYLASIHLLLSVTVLVMFYLFYHSKDFISSFIAPRLAGVSNVTKQITKYLVKYLVLWKVHLMYLGLLIGMLLMGISSVFFFFTEVWNLWGWALMFLLGLVIVALTLFTQRKLK